MKNLLPSLFLGLLFAFPALAETDSTTLIHTGDKAYLFDARTIHNKTFTAGELAGKVVMINFFATWCGPCNQELPELQSQVWEKYKNHPDFVLLVVGREHTEQQLLEFEEKKKLQLPFVPDPVRGIFGKYATKTIPRNVIINKKGEVVYEHAGYSKEEFAELLQVLTQQLK